MFDNLTPVSQGSLGLTYAIAYLTKKGYTVSIPLIDNQNYDLVCDINGTLNKVQVKSTRYVQNGNYVVQLKSVRPNRTGNSIRHFNSNSVDYLLAVTEICDIYFIPSSKIKSKNTLALGIKYIDYKDKL